MSSALILSEELPEETVSFLPFGVLIRLDTLDIWGFVIEKTVGGVGVDWQCFERLQELLAKLICKSLSSPKSSRG